jgi:cysteine desulfurase
MRPIYLDFNATTPLLPEAWEAMRPFFFDHAGNPASSHHAGRHARRALENARALVAHLIDAHPDEVIFTSGATEANNLALFGLCGAPPGTIVSSAIEHPCVREPIEQLRLRGFTHVELPVDRQGIAVIEDTVIDGVRLAALMLANHETGAIQPVAQLAAKLAGTPIHCDAAAAAGKMPLSFRRLDVATMTISGHKFHGPKGIGALIARRTSKLRPLLWGGHQQQGRRPGTEPVPLAVGMATALESAVKGLETNRDKARSLRQRFLERLRKDAAPVVLNGPEEGGLPHTLNVSFPGCRADVLLMNLDLAGVACATGSACSSGSLLPSPVLRAMAVSDDALASALRFSFSHVLAREDIDEAVDRIILIVNRLR